MSIFSWSLLVCMYIAQNNSDKKVVTSDTGTWVHKFVIIYSLHECDVSTYGRVSDARVMTDVALLPVRGLMLPPHRAGFLNNVVKCSIA